MMKNVFYSSNVDFESLLINANGRYNFKSFLLFFVFSVLGFSCLPIDVLFEEIELIDKIMCSLPVTFLGGYVSKEISKRNAKKQLSLISKSLEEEQLYIPEENLEKAVTSTINTMDDRNMRNGEIINYFLVLDRNEQIKVLESIKIDLSLGRERLQDNILCVFDDNDLKNIVIPEDEIQKLRLGGKYDKTRVQRKIK